MSNSRRWREFLQWWDAVELNGLSAGELADMIDERIRYIKGELI